MLPRSKQAKLFRLDRWFHHRHGLIAGVDEVGRGPLAGPVVAAAVILPLTCSIPSLNDSKKLTAAQRFQIYQTIQQQALSIGVGMCSPEEIDALNIYHATVRAMQRALQALAFQPKHVLVDGLRLKTLGVTHTALVKGDGRSAHIAAASVVAKVTRDQMMEAYHAEYPDYGFNEHKGYPTPLHLAQLAKVGACPIHRKSFGPVRQAELAY